MSLWYFAFGSDMSSRRMKRLVKVWEDAKRAVLKGYEAGFYAYSPQWGCGVLDIVEKEGGSVVGVAYLITEDQSRILDGYEGVPRISRRLHVTVEVEGSGKLDAYTYTHTIKRKFVQPAKHYVDAVLSGLSEWGYEDVAEAMSRLAGKP